MTASVAAVLLLLAGTCWVAPGSADDVEVELVGFLGRLPHGGPRLAPAGGTTTRFEVPNEQGGARGPDTGRLRSGQLVILEGMLQRDRFRIMRIREIEVAEYGGRTRPPPCPAVVG